MSSFPLNGITEIDYDSLSEPEDAQESWMLAMIQGMDPMALERLAPGALAEAATQNTAREMLDDLARHPSSQSRRSGSSSSSSSSSSSVMPAEEVHAAPQNHQPARRGRGLSMWPPSNATSQRTNVGSVESESERARPGGSLGGDSRPRADPNAAAADSSEDELRSPATEVPSDIYDARGGRDDSPGPRRARGFPSTSRYSIERRFRHLLSHFHSEGAAPSTSEAELDAGAATTTAPSRFRAIYRQHLAIARSFMRAREGPAPLTRAVLNPGRRQALHSLATAARAHELRIAEAEAVDRALLDLALCRAVDDSRAVLDEVEERARERAREWEGGRGRRPHRQSASASWPDRHGGRGIVRRRGASGRRRSEGHEEERPWVPTACIMSPCERSGLVAALARRTLLGHQLGVLRQLEMEFPRRVARWLFDYCVVRSTCLGRGRDPDVDGLGAVWNWFQRSCWPEEGDSDDDDDDEEMMVLDGEVSGEEGGVPWLYHMEGIEG